VVAMKCPLQTSPVSQPPLCSYINIAVPHSPHTLHCTIRFPQQKIAPSMGSQFHRKNHHWARQTQPNGNSIVSTVIPQYTGQTDRPTPHGRDWTRLLHAQYPLQTNPITQLRVRYIYTTMPHAFYTLHCASCPIPSSQLRNLPLP